MATPLQNAQFAQTLFDPLRQSVARNLDTRAAIAQREADMRLQTIRQNLLRAQALEDQQAEARARTALQESQNIAAAQRNRESLTFQDQKLTAAEKAVARERVAEAYREYKRLGGKDTLKDFGEADSLDTLFNLNDAIAPLQIEAQKKQAEAGATLLGGMRDELNAMANLSDAEVSEEISNVIALAATNEEYEKPLKALNKLIGEKPDIQSLSSALAQVGQRYPAFATAMGASLRSQINTRRMEKLNSPEYANKAREFRDAQEGIIKSFRDPLAATEFYANLNNRSQRAGDAGGGLEVLNDPGKIKVGGAGEKTPGKPKPDAVGVESPVANLRENYSSGGLIGAVSGLGPINPRDALRALRDPQSTDTAKAVGWVGRNLPYLAATPLQVIGGDRLVEATGLDQYDTLRTQPQEREAAMSLFRNLFVPAIR